MVQAHLGALANSKFGRPEISTSSLIIRQLAYISWCESQKFSFSLFLPLYLCLFQENEIYHNPSLAYHNWCGQKKYEGLLNFARQDGEESKYKEELLLRGQSAEEYVQLNTYSLLQPATTKKLKDMYTYIILNRLMDLIHS